ncbi:MAG TPA: tRNA (adenosine(37)-N6)-threonylcarbamoyltransferase complex ATPase subunit type 1 TsaE [Ruminococcaceae bacterium]|nr:tRNA (adenosine(37)-N6)-threonylcarbamoyltransferase complex ATPase subunit type 1 TsaE [Oscillospiraceae bacterium]
MVSVTTGSENETEALGEKISSKLKGGEVLALFGGMGMGKTAFTRGLAKGLGVRSGVSSPTFALMHEYRGRLTVYHFDMFRIETWDDLSSTGFFDCIDAGGVTVIEWSENIENALPAGSIKIRISRGQNDNLRVFEIEGMDI